MRFELIPHQGIPEIEVLKTLEGCSIEHAYVVVRGRLAPSSLSVERASANVCRCMSKIGYALPAQGPLYAGKPPKLIIGAMMRKLIHVAFGVFKSGKNFDPTLHGG
jgi:hypothetical protein